MRKLFCGITFLALFSCKQQETTYEKEIQLHHYATATNLHFANFVNKQYDEVKVRNDKRLSHIHSIRLRNTSRLDSIRVLLMKRVGAYDKDGYIGNRDLQLINKTINDSGIGLVIFNDLQDFYKNFDTAYYHLHYLGWDTKVNFIYKNDPKYKDKNFVELNLNNSSLDQLFVTLEMFRRDMLNYELIEIYEQKCKNCL